MTPRKKLAVASTVLALALSAPAAGVVLRSVVTPDGAYRVELADYTVSNRFELWRIPVAGGSRLHLGIAVPNHTSVEHDFSITRDSKRVVYRQGPSDGQRKLYSAPLTGSPGPDIQGAMTAGSAVQVGVTLIPDYRFGEVVRFQCNCIAAQTMQWFRVPVASGVRMEEIFVNGFESGNREEWR